MVEGLKPVSQDKKFFFNISATIHLTCISFGKVVQYSTSLLYNKCNIGI